MRILLAHNSLYYPSHGGGDKSNRLLMEALAERGHDVHVVTRVERFGPGDHGKLLRELSARGVEARTDDEGIVHFAHKGVAVFVVAMQPNIRPYFSKKIAEFDPDIILTSTDDPGQLLFDLAVKAPRARVVHLVRATIAVPFGPDSSAPNAAKTELLKRADGIVGVSQYVASYVREFGSMDAVHVPISLLEPVEDYPDLGRFDSPYVTLTNPCAVKGIDIFLGLADRLPHVQFAAVPTWGTTAEDMTALRARTNISVLPPVDDIDDLLRQTRVMLVPSVWAEARSRIVVEAMSRGVPVVSSDAGGIPEAHLGVDYMLPVNLIRRYKPSVDLNMVPVAEVPPQDLGPWQAALDRLTSDRAHWEDLSKQSREAALEYARNLNVLPFESLLQETLARPKKSATPAPAPNALSDEKRKLLALRLKQKSGQTKAASDPWFPDLAGSATDKPRLFCFPHAGGGTAAFRGWRESLRDVVDVIPVRLPGRETRLAELPIDSMESLISRLGDAIATHVSTGRFAFFGHSMGGGVAFELARWLRSRRLAMPEVLIVSGVRAPQWRLGLQPLDDPDDAQLLEQLRRLEGMPHEVLENSELLKLALPALRADTRLFRRYVYHAEPPLPTPIAAYVGSADANLATEHMEAWREMTAGRFDLRVFRGGHFYFQTAPGEVFEALRTDLKRE